MKISFNFFNPKKISCVLLMIVGLFSSSFAQTMQNGAAVPKSPRQEKLLNGLRVLMWSDPAADKVTIRLRVHSGSAFDPQGREGVFSLLSANIFPNEAAREYFAEDLGGSLDQTVNYDYLQINASAKPENLLSLLETLGRAVSAPVIDKDTTAKLKAAQLEKLKTLETDADYVADQAAAKRLFGTFPYGRPISGTTDSVTKIDYADLLLAKQKFLTSDNATLAISGNFKPDYAFRALRRYFGGWQKADKLVPSAFRQPDAPETQPLVIKTAAPGNAQIRFLTRGTARNDQNFAASEILSEILRTRAAALVPAGSSNTVKLQQEPHILPGVIVLSQDLVQPAPDSAAAKSLLPDNAFEQILAKPVTSAEFAGARDKVSAAMTGRDLIDWRLDVDTFLLSSVADDLNFFRNASLEAVEAYRQKIAKQSIVIVRAA